MFPREIVLPCSVIGYLIVAGRREQVLCVMVPVQFVVELLRELSV
jgi:hypothetical protein